jgi:Enoyl-(Acyl carrier protein) reductase
MVGLAIPGMSHYIATKMRIIGFMRGLANDVANDGVTANAVLPGLTNTQAIAPQTEKQKRSTWEQQAIKRLGELKDITGAILFRTSDAAFITGAGNCCGWWTVSHRLMQKRRSLLLATGLGPGEPEGIRDAVTFRGHDGTALTAGRASSLTVVHIESAEGRKDGWGQIIKIR